METKRKVEKIKVTKSWFFERINVIDRPFARHTKKKRDSNEIRNARGMLQLILHKYKGS